ncbi:MAG: DNA repair protein RecN [Deltaproteobacteria bacterium]|nr:DNA repair protein RecN [Deltaproteobacteria bacterium]
MLAHLRIRDFVLIDELDLELSSGFNVLTGETGAGKSLVAAAMDLLLGRRGRGDLVRRAAKEAEVEGLFDVSDEPAVKKRLEEAGLPVDNELLIRRVIPTKGRHRCYINGRLASLGLLSETAEGLARLMSQHEQHSLLEPAKQLEMLDGFGGLESNVIKMAELHKQSEEAAKALEDLKNREHDRAGRLDYLTFQAKEIDRLAPEENELEELEPEIERLRHRENLVGAAAHVAAVLYENDGSVFDKLGSSTKKLEEVVRYDESLSTSARQLAEAAALVEDAAHFLAGYGRAVDADPERLAEMEERREELNRLTRKHGTDLAGVLALRDRLFAEIETLSGYEEAIDTAEKNLSRCREKEAAHAVKLTKSRMRVAKKLARAIADELADLEFGDVGFEVSLEPTADGSGPTGADKAEFLVALNPGEGAHPLRRVASGGELSRLMLAVKRAFAGVGPVGTYVFDEVDAGIGGAVAAAVGNKLKEVASHHQVICITHLPQIAAIADAHFHVSKEAKRGRTATRIGRLDDTERVEEVARMLGGQRVTKKTREAAMELMAR